VCAAPAFVRSVSIVFVVCRETRVLYGWLECLFSDDYLVKVANVDALVAVLREALPDFKDSEAVPLLAVWLRVGLRAADQAFALRSPRWSGRASAGTS
jgi:hypothetical protein